MRPVKPLRASCPRSIASTSPALIDAAGAVTSEGSESTQPSVALASSSAANRRSVLYRFMALSFRDGTGPGIIVIIVFHTEPRRHRVFFLFDASGIRLQEASAIQHFKSNCDL